jgi:NitT/TauT family transport system substrate-binding protein
MKNLTFMLLVLALLLCPACSRREPAAPAQDPDPAQPPAAASKPIRVVMLPFISFLQFYIAEKEGYFKEQGLEIEFVPLGGGPEGLALLPLGEVDVYGGSVNAALINAIARGGRMRIVADKGYVGENDLYFSIMTRKELADSGELDAPGGLKGRTVTLTPNSSLQYYFECVLKENGVGPTEVRYEFLPNPMLQEALLNKAIDLSITGDPWMVRMLKTGKLVLWKPACDVVPGLQYAITSFGPSLLDERREDGRKFMIAYLKGVRKYNEGKTEKNMQYAAEYTGLDPKLIGEMTWPCVRGDGTMNLQSIRDFQAWAVERGIVDRAVSDDQLWDLEFIEQANNALDASIK